MAAQYQHSADTQPTLPTKPPPVVLEWETKATSASSADGSSQRQGGGYTLPFASQQQRKPSFFKTSLAPAIDAKFPPWRTYTPLNLRRRTFFILLVIVPLALLILVIGLGVGLSKKSGNGVQNLPLPGDAEQHTGDLTYYEPGLGACGITSSSDEDIVAVSHYTWDAVQPDGNPNSNPLCGLKLRATRWDDAAGEQRSVDLTVVDRCTGCEPTDIDTTTSVFEELATIDQGRVPVTWAWLEPLPS